MLRLHRIERKSRQLLKQESGMTIVELLIAAVLSAIVAGGALDFYVAQHESWITQENVSEMQQSLRVSAEELSSKLRNAGASLPEGLTGLRASNTNPDTIAVRFNASPTSLTVGDPTSKRQAVPVHVLRYSDLGGFTVGERVYIYRPPNGPGEWFTVTRLADNAGTGWKEVHHQGQDLINDPETGDVILKLCEVRYWIDRTTDSLHPRLMRQVNGDAQIYADEICDLQGRYVCSDGTIVDQPVAGDTIVAVDFSLAAQTVKRTLKLAGTAGRLIRQTNSHVLLRNEPGAG